jgi:hypothetical protein
MDYMFGHIKTATCVAVCSKTITFLDASNTDLKATQNLAERHQQFTKCCYRNNSVILSLFCIHDLKTIAAGTKPAQKTDVTKSSIKDKPKLENSW